MIPVIDRVMSKIEYIPFSGCWIFMGAVNSFGYGIVGTGGRGAPNDRAHRITYRHFKGAIPHGMIVCHQCDVPSCCNPYHLFLGTHHDNHHDAKSKGRTKNPPKNTHLRGERHYAAKFTAEQVAAFRKEMATGASAYSIAKREGVRQSCIAKMRAGQTWR